MVTLRGDPTESTSDDRGTPRVAQGVRSALSCLNEQPSVAGLRVIRA
jgi:hypothetical protein